MKALWSMESAMRPPSCDVFMGVIGRKVAAGTSPRQIIELLGSQLTSAVLWEDVVRAMLREGCRQFYECGPLQQLKGMMKRIDEDAFDDMVCMDHIQQNMKD